MMTPPAAHNRPMNDYTWQQVIDMWKVANDFRTAQGPDIWMFDLREWRDHVHVYRHDDALGTSPLHAVVGVADAHVTVTPHCSLCEQPPAVNETKDGAR